MIPERVRREKEILRKIKEGTYGALSSIFNGVSKAAFTTPKLCRKRRRF